MDQKKVVIGIGAVLIVLFLATIGSFFTGYAVLNQKELTLENYPCPFIKNNAPNNLYIVTPVSPNAEETQAAKNIANSLERTKLMHVQIINDKEIPQGIYNFILIGNPCDNELVAQQLETDKCDLGLNEGDGYIKLVNADRASTVIISGYNSNALLKAATVISNYKFYPLRGTQIRVYGNPQSLFLDYF